MQQLNTSLNYVNETDLRGRALAALIKQYLNLDTDYGQLLLTTPNLRFPHIFVDPRGGQDVILETTGGKYELSITYMITWFVIDNSPQDVVSLCTSIEEALIKLLSVNALDDQATAHTQQFCVYSPYWLYSEMGKTLPTPTFPNPLSANDTESWMRAGRMPFKTIKYGVNK
jgi:hypothetical protein